MFGQEIKCPIGIMFGKPQGDLPSSCSIAYFEWLQQTLKTAFQFAHTQLKISASRQKYSFDKNLKIRSFDENSYV